MKKLVDFYCPGCDRHLSAEEKYTGKSVECPRCGKKFSVPSKTEAEKDKFLRSAYDIENKKYADWLKSRLKIIKAGEKKHRKSEDPGEAIPPWLKKAVERMKKNEGKNPLDGFDLVDMDKSEEAKEE